MFQIIDGHALAEKIKDDIVNEIVKLADRRPNLAIILIGDRGDSKIYVDLKEREAKKVGIETHLYKCPKNVSEQKVLEVIKYLNEDELIDAILVQLPLPDTLNADVIIKAISPNKDVDRFHPDNLHCLLKTCDHQHVMPPVFFAILEMLKSVECRITRHNVCIVCNSDIFGKSLAKVLECKGAKITIAFAGDKNLSDQTKKADILITAVGKPKFIKENMVKKGAIVIDVGITQKGNKVFGDVDFNNVKNKTSFIAPVPGGIGPLTIAVALKNTLELYKKRK